RLPGQPPRLQHDPGLPRERRAARLQGPPVGTHREPARDELQPLPQGRGHVGTLRGAGLPRRLLPGDRPGGHERADARRLGVITQPTSPEGTDYYVEGAGQNNIGYDPEGANELLDGLGLTETNADGVRLMEDGRPLQIVLSYVEDNAMVPRTDAFNMARDNLADVGIDLVLRPVDGSLYAELRGGNDFDMSGTTVAEDDWDLEPVWYIPTAANSHSAPGYGQWYVSDGAEGIEPP